MRKTIKILILLVLALQSQQINAKPIPEVWLEIRNATAFEEEFIRKDLSRKAKGIVTFKRDSAFGFDKGVDYDGGIRIDFVEDEEDEEDLFIESVRKITAYNIDLEQIEIQSIKINRATINLFQEQNRLYAFINSIAHGVLCHATTMQLEHPSWGLHRSDLSTDKAYWNKKHRKWQRKHLNLPGRTGEVLE